MTEFEQIMQRQQEWAKSRSLNLIGSAGDRGVKNYTQTLDDNLFEPLTDAARSSFSRGSGNEIVSTPEHTAKMQAIHSSSALGVNVFGYWQRLGQYAEIASACGLCASGDCPCTGITFEAQHPIPGVERIPPHLDMQFENGKGHPQRVFAIESKFSEPYSPRGHGGLNPTYLGIKPLWQSLPELHRLAQDIEGEDHVFSYLHAAQLIKHILGLSAAYGQQGFKLLNLWYRVEGEASVKHQLEIETFAKAAAADGIDFQSLTYQEVFETLQRNLPARHNDYLTYLKSRYF